MIKIFDFEKRPVVDIVNEILVDAVKKGASDIHFDPKDDLLQIRIRIDGDLIDYATVPKEYEKNLITRIKIISGMNITESRLPQDGSIEGIIEDIELDLRVSTINTNKGEKIVIRILDYSLSLSGLDQLGFSGYNYKKIVEMINEPNGIILVTGATGTGKTTTVYSMLQRLNTSTTNIMTIEDPIEMDIEGINQIQVNPEIGLTFASALRSILRQDPNIIMIGEIRDSETAAIAIRASITGHLVLSTVHTNDSLSTIERLMDMDVEKYLLADALTGIVSQKLARKLCPHCKRKRSATEYEKELIKKTLNKDVDEIYEAVGCDKCNKGYKGRTALQEVLKINQEIKDALSMNTRKNKLRKLVYDKNVITLLQDGMIKVVRGDTTIEEVLRLIELDKENDSNFNLDEAIIDSELTKEDNSQLEELLDSDSNNQNDIDEIEDIDEVEEGEFIIPETSDVVIDSIDDKDNDEINSEDQNDDKDQTDDLDNMDSLDNDEDFIDKISDIDDNSIGNYSDSDITDDTNDEQAIDSEDIVDNDSNIDNSINLALEELKNNQIVDNSIENYSDSDITDDTNDEQAIDSEDIIDNDSNIDDSISLALEELKKNEIIDDNITNEDKIENNDTVDIVDLEKKYDKKNNKHDYKINYNDKNNIDLEKIKQLEELQNETKSTLNKMLNKKRYKKSKKK